MDRRALLKAIGAALVAGFEPSCSSRSSLPSPNPLDGTVGALPRVKVAPDRIIRTIAGLRPFRPSGFRVQLEKVDSKAVIHNYGHGGAGITFSWGTANLVVEQALQVGEGRCAVIGCGVVGLSTARLLQDHGFDVTIYAKKLPPDTTSNVAGGLWSPHAVADAHRRTPAFDEAFAQAARFSHRYFQNLIGEDYGVRWLDTYVLSAEPPGAPSESALVPDLFRERVSLSGTENPFSWPHALRFKTMLIEPPRYLRALVRDFLLRGGDIVVREFHHLEEVMALSESLIVNCSGLGAGELFADDEIIPIKGQLTVLLPQREVDYIVIANDLYMMPRSDGIILGGTHERGVSSLEPNAQASKRILEGNARLFAEMKSR